MAVANVTTGGSTGNATVHGTVDPAGAGNITECSSSTRPTPPSTRCKKSASQGHRGNVPMYDYSKGVYSDPIPYNATLTELSQALEAKWGAGTVSVTGATGRPVHGGTRRSAGRRQLPQHLRHRRIEPYPRPCGNQSRHKARGGGVDAWKSPATAPCNPAAPISTPTGVSAELSGSPTRRPTIIASLRSTPMASPWAPKSDDAAQGQALRTEAARRNLRAPEPSCMAPTKAPAKPTTGGSNGDLSVLADGIEHAGRRNGDRPDRNLDLRGRPRTRHDLLLQGVGRKQSIESQPRGDPEVQDAARGSEPGNEGRPRKSSPTRLNSTPPTWVMAPRRNTPSNGAFASVYGNTTPVGTTSASGPQGLVPAELTGLELETVYHYRIVATNALGTTYGTDMSFKTHPAGLRARIQGSVRP